MCKQYGLNQRWSHPRINKDYKCEYIFNTSFWHLIVDLSAKNTGSVPNSNKDYNEVIVAEVLLLL